MSADNSKQANKETIKKEMTKTNQQTDKKQTNNYEQQQQKQQKQTKGQTNTLRVALSCSTINVVTI